jgi:hypothetical protein
MELCVGPRGRQGVQGDGHRRKWCR